MNYFVKTIKVNKLLHLQDFSIDIHAENPHLIITGKNGSGKTILLKAIADFLDIVKADSSMHFTNYYKQLEFWTNKKNSNAQEAMQAAQYIDIYQNKIDTLYGKVDIARFRLPLSPIQHHRIVFHCELTPLALSDQKGSIGTDLSKPMMPYP